MRSCRAVAFLVVTAGSAAARAQELPSEARIAYVRNDVDVVQGGEHRAAVGEWLHRGDRVRTGAGARAEVWLPNGATVVLEERSLLVLFASNLPSPPGAPPSNVTTLVRGALQVTPATPDPEHAALLPVGTAAGSVLVGRNEVRIDATTNGAVTRFAVYRGRARVHTTARDYVLDAGFGAIEQVGGGWATPHALPAPPVWRPPPPTRVLSFGAPIEVGGGFVAGRGGRPAQWFVEVARDREFREVVESALIPGRTPRWQGRPLGEGVWYARVYALSAERLMSAPSAAAQVSIVMPLLRPGTLGPPGRRATVVVPDGYYCALGNGIYSPPGTVFPLAPAQSYQLRCALTPNGREPRTWTIPADQSGPLVHEIRMGDAVGRDVNRTTTSVMTLVLRDAEGHPLNWANLVAMADQGVMVPPFRETESPGTYTTLLRWPPGVASARVHIVVNGSVEIDHDAQPQRVRQSPPPPLATVPHTPDGVEILRAPVRPPPDPDDEEPQE